MQTELAFTLAKNATKPNPFEIISLQTMRKKNNWKNEEMLARAVVTVERNGSKGPILDDDDDDDDLYMFRAGLLLIIRRYYCVYTAGGTCNAFIIYSRWYM
jgi:hypothetical protein